jgi:segregation and condensation protein B
MTETADRNQELRLLEAMLFASAEPLEEAAMAGRVADASQIRELLTELQALYHDRGVTLQRVGDRWAFRTAPDLAGKLRLEVKVPRKLSRAAVETLAIIAYHQPVTRAEMEDIRGVGQSKGTLDVLLEAGWIRPGRRRKSPGRPVTWVTTEKFLDHFALASLDDLPGAEELKASGLLDARPAAAGFKDNALDPLSDEAEAAEEEPEDDPLEDEPLEAEEAEEAAGEAGPRGNVEPLFPDEKA